MSIITLDKSHCESAKARPPGSRYAVPVLIDVRQRDWLSLEILPPDRPPDFDPDSPAAAPVPSLDQAEAPTAAAVVDFPATMPTYTRDQLAQMQATPLQPIVTDLPDSVSVSLTVGLDAGPTSPADALTDYAGGTMPPDI